jgi:hypothetical protein
MRSHRTLNIGPALLLGLAGLVGSAGLTVLAGAATPATAAEVHRELTFKAQHLEVRNLIGAVRVQAAGGDRFEVALDIRGKDAEEGLVDIHQEEGRDALLELGFPLDDHKRFVYPEMSGHCSFSIGKSGGESATWWEKLFGGRKVEVSGSGRGLELWADLTIGVPEGGSLDVRHGAGHIEAIQVDGDLNLDINCGQIDGRQLHGRKIVCDTGSGMVSLEDVSGEVVVDTGSGQVEVAQHSGGDLRIDTGSGGVRISDADCGYLLVDTGSGGVSARGVGAESMKIDTGSGAVSLELVRMGEGKFLIDTGSGAIDLDLPPDASASVTADTGSGGVDIEDLTNVKILRKESHYAEFMVGQAGQEGGSARGAATVTLDAGSGSITVR